MEERLLVLVRFMLKQRSSSILIDGEQMYLQTDLGYALIRKCKDDYKMMSYLKYLAGFDFGNGTVLQKKTFFVNVDGMIRRLSFEASNGSEQGLLILEACPIFTFMLMNIQLLRTGVTSFQKALSKNSSTEHTITNTIGIFLRFLPVCKAYL